MRTIVLGLNTYHADAAAALLIDGEIVAAAEEERFRRVKHWAGLPAKSVAWCLGMAGITLSDVDLLAVNRDPRANLLRKVGYVVRRRPAPRLVLDRLQNLSRIQSVSEALEVALGGDRSQRFHGDVCKVEHHLAHQASAFLASPFGEASLLAVDGFGDFASTSWGIGRDTNIELDGRILFPHSLGIFYLTMTQFLGFNRYGDEYKVMGLAPYGKPRHLHAMRQIVRTKSDGTFDLDLAYFRHQATNLAYRWEGGAPTVQQHFTPDLEELLGPARTPDEELTDRHRDIARSVQARFEETVLDLLDLVDERYATDAVCLSGGAAMNSVANGKALVATRFRRVFVPPAPGDAGGAIGAALVAWHEKSGAARGTPMESSSLGPEFDDSACLGALKQRSVDLEARAITVEKVLDADDLCSKVAPLIASGLVVGWFEGRMEFGPRALGHRSILCDPRRRDMREKINAKIKLREPFRPFAPSILHERMGDWFEVVDDIPFMMKVYPIRPEVRHEVPAVTHVDGTGRAQTVTAEAHPLYHRLIRAFEEETGVPMVLNTSFNENEPIVNCPEEALDCFLRTEMDVLALGPYLVCKASAREGAEACGR